MLTVIKNIVRYSPDSSQPIGYNAGQESMAYYAAVEYILKHPNASKYDLFKQLTVWRKDREKWNGKVQIHRAGATRGREAVRAFDRATLNTLAECRKEVAGKKFKDVKQDPDINRLYRRKQRIAVHVDDKTVIKLIDSRTIRVAGMVLKLQEPVSTDVDIRAVQILERKSSCRKSRNRSLSDRSYNIHLIINIPDPEPKEILDKPVGIDLGIAHTVADSHGNFYDQPKIHEERINNLKERQKRLKLKGRQWQKLQKLVRKESKHISNIKDNWEHHVAKEIARDNTMVVMEDLKHKNIRKSAKGTNENPGRNVDAKKGLNRSWANARPGAIRSKIKRHCEKEGSHFREASARYTSQTCPECGFRAKKNRKSQAEFLCLCCGFNGNADTVGAINIKDRGVKAEREARRRVGEPSLGSGSSSMGVAGHTLTLLRHSGGAVA